MQAPKIHNLLRTCIARTISKKNYHQANYPVTTYNDLPTPQGSWQTHYDAQQRKYNGHLILGIATLVGTIVVAKASGLLYLNYYPPSKPADDITYN